MTPKPEELIPTRWTLIRRLKDWDDQEGWREFFDTYWKLIYSAAIRSGLRPAEAQEVVQETVVSVCKSIKDFQANPGRGSFKGWLLNLTRWRIIDQARKRKAEGLRPTRRSGGEGDSDEASTATTERIPDPAGNSLDTMWESEWKKNLVDVALKRLEQQINAKHYQVFYLSHFREVAPQKVASAVGVSVDQVYVINHRAVSQFRKIIGGLDADLV